MFIRHKTKVEKFRNEYDEYWEMNIVQHIQSDQTNRADEGLDLTVIMIYKTKSKYPTEKLIHPNPPPPVQAC